MPANGPAQIDEARVGRSPNRVRHRNAANVGGRALDEVGRHGLYIDLAVGVHRYEPSDIDRAERVQRFKLSQDFIAIPRSVTMSQVSVAREEPLHGDRRRTGAVQLNDIRQPV